MSANLHDCRVGSSHDCIRNGKPAEVSIPRCPHGCYLPPGQTIARDLNGRPYCMVCHWDEHERRRTNVLSPMYREWPLLERRHKLEDIQCAEPERDRFGTITAPFGVERFIYLRRPVKIEKCNLPRTIPPASPVAQSACLPKCYDKDFMQPDKPLYEGIAHPLPEMPDLDLLEQKKIELCSKHKLTPTERVVKASARPAIERTDWPWTLWEAPSFVMVPLGIYPAYRQTCGVNSHRLPPNKAWNPSSEIIGSPAQRRIGESSSGVRQDDTARRNGRRYEDYKAWETAA